MTIISILWHASSFAMTPSSFACSNAISAFLSASRSFRSLRISAVRALREPSDTCFSFTGFGVAAAAAAVAVAAVAVTVAVAVAVAAAAAAVGVAAVGVAAAAAERIT